MSRFINYPQSFSILWLLKKFKVGWTLQYLTFASKTISTSREGIKDNFKYSRKWTTTWAIACTLMTYKKKKLEKWEKVTKARSLWSHQATVVFFYHKPKGVFIIYGLSGGDGRCFIQHPFQFLHDILKRQQQT